MEARDFVLAHVHYEGMVEGAQDVDRVAIHAELEAARARFRDLLDHATADRLRVLTQGTRWSNEELLFHMLFGYLVVRALLPLVRAFGSLPPAASRRFAALLDAVTGPFDLVNYYGSRVGAKLIDHRRMGRAFNRVVAGLRRHLATETDATLARTMAFPTRWDPFFRPTMTLADVYRYPGQHFEFHRQQLTLGVNRT